MLSLRRFTILPTAYQAVVMLIALLVSDLAYSQAGKTGLSGKVGLLGCPPTQCLSVSVKHLIPRPAPVEVAALPNPEFLMKNGSVSYGTEVRLAINKAAVGCTIEYSTDNGQTWVTGSSVVVLKQGTVLARTRDNNRISGVTSATFDVHFNRMFVLGNSIMLNSPVPALGWYNTNGMAASSLQNDFVHILERNLMTLNPSVQMKLISGGGFERNFWAFDYNTSLDEHLSGYAPDLIVVRIGENINDAEAANPSRDFKARYRQLLDKLTQFSGRAKVVCTTSFWNHPQASAMIREVAAERGYPVADLYSVLYNRPDRDQFQAVTEYTDPGVGAHPNDRGMAEIARLIWEKIR